MANIGGYHHVKCDHPLFWIFWLVTELPFNRKISTVCRLLMQSSHPFSQSTSFLHCKLVLMKSNSSSRIYTTQVISIGGYHHVKCDHPLFWISWLVTVPYPNMIYVATSSTAARSSAKLIWYFLHSLRFHNFACSFTQTADSDKRFNPSPYTLNPKP
jgi:hypothetical protein